MFNKEISQKVFFKAHLCVFEIFYLFLKPNFVFKNPICERYGCVQYRVDKKSCLHNNNSLKLTVYIIMHFIISLDRFVLEV